MTIQIGLLLFPRMTQLDLTGPLEVFHRVPGAELSLIWKDLEPVRTTSGMRVLPTATLSDAPRLDLLVIPGGYGTAELLDDAEVLTWIATQAKTARYVTSVCTGALLLGAAGLLDGYNAATHWAYMDLLPLFGARPVRQRVVVDRNRITAGGVTAGIDFGFRIAAELLGDEGASAIQLGLEYDPEPPFRCGHPDRAAPAMVERVRTLLEPAVAMHRAKAEQWRASRP
ncbi:MAG TPA: DJ-1/PfpI family protein [Polyangiaceae bacterium]|jgi:cyclohexyl-isocyanide hydratase|nr:DJ-1/PfpI family protein [Polyangiaceae bacterium]